MESPRSKSITVQLLRVTRELHAQPGDDLMVLGDEVIGVCTEQPVYRTKQRPPAAAADRQQPVKPSRRGGRAGVVIPGSTRHKVREIMAAVGRPLTTGQILEAMGMAAEPDAIKAGVRHAIANLRSTGQARNASEPGQPAAYVLTDAALTGGTT